MKKILTILIMTLTTTLFGQVEQKSNFSDFLPKGYVIFEEIKGDLNKDGVDDYVLIIKGTNKSKIITDQSRGKLDRNRRGIIVLFTKKDDKKTEKNNYELGAKNYNCFSSENEDGGVYFAPELSVKIMNGNLYILYGHGRYGFWEYTFRYQNAGFELIGYDATNGGAVVNSQVSINFSTKKKQEKVNTNENAQGGDEVFKETWKNITINKLFKLQEIKDFDEINMTIY